ncbi:MAG TPA: hypothetical protein VKX16_05760 [Chloroflexota bacterium]|nr:hypothetical protein [Chloroflexota bacterium]
MELPLTETEFHDFVDRLERFALGLSASQRVFLTTILLRAGTSQAGEVLSRAGHAGSPLHAHLAYAVWQSTYWDEEGISLNPLPLARDERTVLQGQE